jgi:hypothetical protein
MNHDTHRQIGSVVNANVHLGLIDDSAILVVGVPVSVAYPAQFVARRLVSRYVVDTSRWESCIIEQTGSSIAGLATIEQVSWLQWPTCIVTVHYTVRILGRRL